MTPNPIVLGQPFLPPFDQTVEQLKDLWESRSLTNDGVYVKTLTEALRNHLGVEHLSLVANGTLGLLLSLRALGLKGEVISTPFTFPATTNALLWSGLKPVFVDIDPATFNLDPRHVAAAITPETSAILAVHCFGRPCNTMALAQLASTHELKLIYDAAHAFGVTVAGKNLLLEGDASVLSFHATKVFHTLEGGAVISSNPAITATIDQLRNFGFYEGSVEASLLPGINAKLNEIGALIGLLSLEHMDELHAKRSSIDRLYRQQLASIDGLACLPAFDGDNHSYFPILVHESYPLTILQLREQLKRHNIGSRRYFYPPVSSLPPYRDLPSAHPGNLPVACDIAERILCLPIHAELSKADVLRITGLLRAFACHG
ncbi:MAG: DegT/DnrJ/EryC1/StrS family aminotransferase [Aquiluna sp.]